MKVLISGAGGLVGRALTHHFARTGLEFRPLVRRKGADFIWWDPDTGEINLPALNDWQPDALIHLAGENIVKRRWSAAQKEKIRTSRVQATERLVVSLRKLKKPLNTFIGASAVGYYGSRGDEILTEQSAAGSDFLAEVSRSWEEAASGLLADGTRVVHLRFGMILSAEDGALPRMLTMFKLGLGGRLASGCQWMSWVAIDDVIRIFEWVLQNSASHGAYNALAPNPVTNKEFTRALAKALHRPAFFAVPAVALRLMLGEMADALLLPSQRAVPQRLLESGFQFAFPTMPQALDQILG